MKFIMRTSSLDSPHKERLSVEDLTESVEKLHSKNKQCYNKLQHTIDRLIELIVHSQQQLARLTANGDTSSQRIVQELDLKLKQIKPLTHVRELFVNCYTRLSHFMKEARVSDPNDCNMLQFMRSDSKIFKRKSIELERDSLKLIESCNSIKKDDFPREKVQRFLGQHITVEQLATLQEMLCEHFLRKGEWESANIFNKKEQCEVMQAEQESQNGIQIDLDALINLDVEINLDAQIDLYAQFTEDHKKINVEFFKQCYKLKEEIIEGNYAEAIRWAAEEKLYETYGELLQYELKKMQIIKLVQNNQPVEALDYAKKQLLIFAKHREQQIGQLIGYILFSTSNLWGEANRSVFKTRYEVFDNYNRNREEIGKLFASRFFKRCQLSDFDAIDIIYGVASDKMSEYIKGFTLTEKGLIDRKNKNNCLANLPFSIDLPQSHRYHSLFLCPITKQVVSNEQGGTLLSCGHMISETAARRLAHENRSKRKYKCPICQKDIRTEDNMRVYF